MNDFFGYANGNMQRRARARYGEKKTVAIKAYRRSFFATLQSATPIGWVDCRFGNEKLLTFCRFEFLYTKFCTPKRSAINVVIPVLGTTTATYEKVEQSIVLC
jgi:hypothetical protein